MSIAECLASLQSSFDKTTVANEHMLLSIKSISQSLTKMNEVIDHHSDQQQIKALQSTTKYALESIVQLIKHSTNQFLVASQLMVSVMQVIEEAGTNYTTN